MSGASDELTAGYKASSVLAVGRLLSSRLFADARSSTGMSLKISASFSSHLRMSKSSNLLSSVSCFRVSLVISIVGNDGIESFI